MAARYTQPSEEELAQALVELPGWSLADGKLHRRYRLPSFGSAIAFMVRVAFEAERIDHHPNWSNVYDRVQVELWTHDVGGITDRDLTLARAMEQHARALGAQDGSAA
ncbi:4a-hydroxytetrahydrobiopterin dehydratase [Paraliomyxa miuraensis]|uniref:4a-hydroxytetrahydrobiopterin dehydratase n=1 Tax=Paraliomyxa miuraensis TaxID=376150 RepID=UPI00225189D9|nr:4a-hydroxytetrahydrobiopterin dehydratase [Paraliomyxa miuraensis]MCX4245901.1 4a-hydroxytetrahydrobiopterin dehydratase [Paraliomyxa miuraensis]